MSAKIKMSRPMALRHNSAPTLPLLVVAAAASLSFAFTDTNLCIGAAGAKAAGHRRYDGPTADPNEFNDDDLLLIQTQPAASTVTSGASSYLQPTSAAAVFATTRRATDVDHFPSEITASYVGVVNTTIVVAVDVSHPTTAVLESDFLLTQMPPNAAVDGDHNQFVRTQSATFSSADALEEEAPTIQTETNAPAIVGQPNGNTAHSSSAARCAGAAFCGSAVSFVAAAAVAAIAIVL